MALVHKTWLALLGQLFKVLVFWCGHATSVLHGPSKLFSHLVLRHLSCLKIYYVFLHASRSSERLQMNSEFFFSSSYAATLRNVAPNSLEVSGRFRPWGNTEGEKDSRQSSLPPSFLEMDLNGRARFYILSLKSSSARGWK